MQHLAFGLGARDPGGAARAGRPATAEEARLGGVPVPLDRRRRDRLRGLGRAAGAGREHRLALRLHAPARRPPGALGEPTGTGASWCWRCRRTASARSCGSEQEVSEFCSSSTASPADDDDHAGHGRGGASLLRLAARDAGLRAAVELQQGADRRRTGRCWAPGARARARRGPRSPARSRRRWAVLTPALHRVGDLPGVELRPLAPAAHPARLAPSWTSSRALGWLPAGRFRASPRAKAAALLAWHTPDYVAALERAEAEQAVSEAARARHGLGTDGEPGLPRDVPAARDRGGRRDAGGGAAGATGGAVHVPGGRDAPRLPGPGERVLLPQRPGLRGAGAAGAGRAAGGLRGHRRAPLRRGGARVPGRPRGAGASRPTRRGAGRGRGRWRTGGRGTS